MALVRSSVIRVWLLSVFCLTLGQSQAPVAWAQSDIDCSTVGIEFIDDPNMTREERLEAMDRALQKSLGRYDLCQEILFGKNGADASSNTASGGMAGAGSTNGSKEDGEGGASGNQGKTGENGLADTNSEGTSVPSIASSDIQGAGNLRNNSSPTDTQGQAVQEGGAEEYAAKAGEDNARTQGGQASTVQSPNGGNGAIPEDVQKADNDSVLEAQIREAATREKDPEVRARLWNEYRRYKGLPQK